MGTESNGRDMLAVLLVGAPRSLWIGLIAASIGMLIGIILGFTAGYLGGWVDAVIRTISDSIIVIPALAVLIVIAAYVRTVSIESMALLLALFAWPAPTRYIRAQVLSMRERGYVNMARISGASSFDIMFKEMMPNMLPYLAASFTGNVSGAILAAASLEALGLGPTRIPTLGHDDLLRHSCRRHPARHVVVVGPAHPDLDYPVLRPVPDEHRPGRDRQSSPAGQEEGGGRMTASTGTTQIANVPYTADIGTDVTGHNRTVVLDVRNLKVYYATPSGDVRAVDDVSFQVYEGEILGLVGESGCGKTTTAMAILRMVQPPGRIVGGEVVLDGIDLTKVNDDELRRVRWSTLALIPQGAMNSLNPVMRINDQMAEAIDTHEGRQDKAKLKQRILDLLEQVGLPSRVYDMYPHELSGGMKQRVCIAMAIALHPSLIIADEPTSALDVVVQRVVGQTLLDVKQPDGRLDDPDRPRHGPAGAAGGPHRRHVCGPHGRGVAG